MITYLRTDSSNPLFQSLVSQLDADLAQRDGAEHDFYTQYNSIGNIKHVVVAIDGIQAIACGAIKEYEPGCMEVKRMYTIPAARGKGIASAILKELEQWARELNCKQCILETGKRQPEAIALYQKNGYRSIPNYGQYESVENSVCFEKRID